METGHFWILFHQWHHALNAVAMRHIFPPKFLLPSLFYCHLQAAQYLLTALIPLISSMCRGTEGRCRVDWNLNPVASIHSSNYLSRVTFSYYPFISFFVE